MRMARPARSAMRLWMDARRSLRGFSRSDIIDNSTAERRWEAVGILHTCGFVRASRSSPVQGHQNSSISPSHTMTETPLLLSSSPLLVFRRKTLSTFEAFVALVVHTTLSCIPDQFIRIPLKDMKESHPVDVAECAKA